MKRKIIIKNQVSLVGRIANDLDVKTFENQSQVLNISIAVDDSYVTKEGEVVERAYFITCNARNKMAEHIAKNYKKGYQIGITGKLTTRKYEKDGQNVYNTEVEIATAEIIVRKETKND